jgi:GMP synthase-like glutamine amidotransferase
VSDTRRTILFVTIDRPADIDQRWHDPNAAGVQAAAAAVNRSFTVVRVTIDDLLGLDAAALDAKWSPLAIFSAGSWSEWFHYADDDAWRARLDNYMAIVRATDVPLLAVCGSHQLVSVAFNGWSAVAHMNDGGDPVPITDELAADPPVGLFPAPRVGEEGSYPVVVVDGAEDDPLVWATGDAPLLSVHHKDMVVATDGFTLLYTADPSRPAATTASDQAQSRCRVQALRRDDPTRILYTTQFHPEMPRFSESTQDDAGAGRAWLVAFVEAAAEYWGSP